MHLDAPLRENETIITDPSVKTEEICTFAYGTTLKKTCSKSGDLTEYAFDYRNRSKSTTVHPRTGVALTTTNSYANNLLFSVQDPYGRMMYFNYRSSDSVRTRTVRGTVPAFTLADFAAVAALPEIFRIMRPTS